MCHLNNVYSFFFLSNIYKYLNNMSLQMKAFMNDCMELLYSTGVKWYLN